jgi:hypothetical protein
LAVSVTRKHTIDKISQWAPEVFAARKVVLVDEEDVMLEAGVEMRLKAKLSDYWVVMAVDMGVNSVHSLKNLPNHAGEGFRKLDA